MSAPRRPPPPIPRPDHVQVVRAMFNYTAQQPDELSFEEGDILYIIDRSGSWWKAKVGNRTGLIPSNYVGEHTESVENPLHEAAKRGSCNIVRQAVFRSDACVTVYAENIKEYIVPGNLGFLQECLQNKVSVNGLDKSASTPLHWAAQGGHTECVKVLLAQPRIQISVQNKLGDTPLHSAAWKNHPDIVELLLERGARTDIRNNAKQTPYDLSRDPGVGMLLRGAVEAPGADDYGEEEDSD